ncbi:Pol [Symbiodinium necroappetens]|uniref:Pol protein n=1 Tax=Symbiodinium necroappetens TaxID=1628268 RepID=A0A812NEG3_9DINO|nr:Pol [Symbiodinium necroappetens]
MERVRQYVKDEQGHGLPTREGEDCDLKVIYEVFGRACYKPFDNVATALFSPKSTDCVLDLGCTSARLRPWFLEQGISGADVSRLEGHGAEPGPGCPSDAPESRTA